jgi:hypothetical protein
MLRRLSLSAMCLLVALAGLRSSRAQNIFVTPVPNAPFSGLIEVQRSLVGKGGSAVEMRSTQRIARDSQGRVYIEMRDLTPASSAETPKLLRVLIYDPGTRVSIFLYPQQRFFRETVIDRPPASEPPGTLYASPTGQNMPLNQFTKEEDLGTKQIGGLRVHGTRESQTIPASEIGTGDPVVVTDEYWYSDDLRMNLVIRHADPRTGAVTETVTQVQQNDPDPTLFAVPEGYRSIAAGGSTNQGTAPASEQSANQ